MKGLGVGFLKRGEPKEGVTKEANQNVMKEKPKEKQEAFGNRALGMLSGGTRNQKLWEERMQKRREGASRVRAQNSLYKVC